MRHGPGASNQDPATTTNITTWLFIGGAWAFGGRIGSILATAASTFILARWLRPAELGVYFLGLSIAVFASTLGQLGMDQAVVKLVASSQALGHDDRVPRILRIVFGLSTLGAVAVGMCLIDGPGKWLAGFAFDSALLGQVVFLVGSISGARVLERMVAESFRGLHKIREAVIFGGLLRNWSLVALFFVGLIVVPRGELSQILLVTLVVTTLVAVIGGWRLKAGLPGRGPNTAEPSLFEVVRLAWPLHVTALAYVLLNSLDLWVVGFLLGEEQVAIYGIALRLVLFVSLPLTVVNAVVPPMISGLSATGRLAQLEEALRKSATLAAMPALLIAVVLVIAGGPIIRLAFGVIYATPQTVQVLELLALGQLVSVCAGSCGLTLMMSGYHRDMMAITLLGAAFTLAAALLLGSAIGMTGVALGSASGQILQNLLMWLTVHRRMKIWTHLSPSRVPAALNALLQRATRHESKP